MKHYFITEMYKIPKQAINKQNFYIVLFTYYLFI